MEDALPGFLPESSIEHPDDVLAQQARQQADAFAALYRRHLPAIYRYIMARVGQEADAQDITTATFMAALKSINAYRGPDSFRPWLFGIARHQIARHYRRRPTTVPLDAAARVPHPDPSPETVVGNRMRIDQIAAALARLNPDRAEAVRLRYFASLTTAEIAAVMGKNAAAVRMLIHRGTQDLRNQLEGTSDDIA